MSGRQSMASAIEMAATRPATESVADVLDRLTAERYSRPLWWTWAPTPAEDSPAETAARRRALAADFATLPGRSGR